MGLYTVTSVQLYVCANAEWEEGPLARRSTPGYLVRLNGGIVCRSSRYNWSIKLWRRVIGLAFAAREMLWLIQFLQSIKYVGSDFE